jgi:hypothetical protein
MWTCVSSRRLSGPNRMSLGGRVDSQRISTSGRRRIVIAAALLLLAGPRLVGQAPAPDTASTAAGARGAGAAFQPPPRDDVRALAGTATLRGRVVRAENGGGIPGARVTLSASESGVTRTVETGADGRTRSWAFPPDGSP